MPDAERHRLAYVGRNGQLHVLTILPDGTTATRQFTWSIRASTGMLWGVEGAGSSASWPCWSPDGTQIACFIQSFSETEDAETRVAVVEVDGVREHRFAPLVDRMPIHCQWSPDGMRLAVLVQFEELLELWIAEVGAEASPLRLVAEGSPLFFGWAEHGRRVVLHIGDNGSGDARLEVRDVVGDDDDVVFRIPPSNFCVPFAVAVGAEERVLYVVQRGQHSQIASADLHGEDVLGLGVADGLVALVPSESAARVAFAAAPDADGSPYTTVQCVSVDGSDNPGPFIDGPVVAFFWRPQHGQPIWVTHEGDQRHIQWHCGQPDGEALSLGRCVPTRDTYFHLHFFEQFVRSHPLTSHDGRWLVWASHDAAVDSTGPMVFLTDLNADNPRARPVCPGSYAVFAP